MTKIQSKKIIKMDNLFRILSEYYNSVDFRIFQNDFARSLYETLSIGYSNSDGEVKMVTDMCKTINGKSYGQFKFYSNKIHGTRSYVEFFNQDKPITKELGDMVLISVATRGGDIVYEKIAVVQNKKESTENNWRIDQDQLYLLQNFPTFRGSKGIFKKNYKNDITFLNHSETLGNYGLFKSPGEMILVNALNVFRLQQNDLISFSDIRKNSEGKTNNNLGFQFPFLDHPMWEEMIYHYFKYFPKYGFPFMNLPFLNNSFISFNLYDVIRNFTYFNIGEVASVFGNTINKDLSDFTRLLLKESGLSNVMKLNVEGGELDHGITVLVAHLNLDEK